MLKRNLMYGYDLLTDLNSNTIEIRREEIKKTIVENRLTR